MLNEVCFCFVNVNTHRCTYFKESLSILTGDQVNVVQKKHSCFVSRRWFLGKHKSRSAVLHICTWNKSLLLYINSNASYSFTNHFPLLESFHTADHYQTCGHQMNSIYDKCKRLCAKQQLLLFQNIFSCYMYSKTGSGFAPNIPAEPTRLSTLYISNVYFWF